MHRYAAASAAVAITLGMTVGAARAGPGDDWTGFVKAQEVMRADDGGATDGALADITVDAQYEYDTPGPNGKAWGTMTYMRDDNPALGYTKLMLYYHVFCINRFSLGRYSVVGVLDKQVGDVSIPLIPYMSFAFDTVGQRWRTDPTGTTFAEAKAACKKQSGLFPAAYDHGYVIAR